MLILYIPLFLILLFLLLFLVFIIIQFYNVIFRKYPPLVHSKQKVLKNILNNLEIKENATIYEIGCGTAIFLQKLRKKYPKANLIGVEYSFLPFYTAKIINYIKKLDIKFIKQNFFKLNLHQADVIYCYLFESLMGRLEEKFKKECKPGTIIISYQFRMPKTKPYKILEMGKRDRTYFYKINR